MKRWGFSFLLVALTLITIEVAARLVFATQVGPRVILYGTPWHRREEAPPARGLKDLLSGEKSKSDPDKGEGSS